MRAPLEVRFERLQKLVERVSYESERGAVIVVEGQRDRESLRKLGIAGKILCLQSSRTGTVGFVEGLRGVNEVVVLTDFDRQGVFLAKRLARVLTSQKVRTNLILWRDLRRLARSDIRSIEELPKYFQRLRNQNPSGVRLLNGGTELAFLNERWKVAGASEAQDRRAGK